MALSLIAPPSGFPVSVEEARQHLKLDFTDADAELLVFIAAATGHLDGHHGILGRALLSQQWQWTATLPACAVTLPLAPVISIDSVTVASAGAVDPAAFTLLDADFGRVSIPQEFDKNFATIRFTAGYGAAADVPAPLRQAILLLVGHWFRSREATTSQDKSASTPFGFSALTSPYRRLQP